MQLDQTIAAFVVFLLLILGVYAVVRQAVRDELAEQNRKQWERKRRR